MNGPIVEIYGTGTHNRGAELMAIAAASRIRKKYPDARIVVPPMYGSFKDRAKQNFFTSLELNRSFASDLYWHFAPRSMRRALGAIRAADVDLVIDASGFAFSDQWGFSEAKRLVMKMNKRGQCATNLVLLPQAFGPFEDKRTKIWAKRLFSRASLVCARDRISMDYVKPICESSKIRLYPDFTADVDPLVPEDLGISLPERFAAIVPNARMCDKGVGEGLYFPFLREVKMLMESVGVEPVVLIHDASHDRSVVERAGIDAIQVVQHPNPQALKGVLGRARFVVGSRFHALVSGLSQSVPCVAAGWSHKYPELLSDFGCPELLLNDLGDHERLRATISLLADDEECSKKSDQISVAVEGIKQRIDEMWSEALSPLD